MPIAVRYSPTTTLYRVSYGNPTDLPPWLYVGEGRFDDPLETYRVLYTSTSEVGACIERFQEFRPSPAMATEEAEFELDGSLRELAEHLVAEVPSGTLPFDKFAALLLGRLSIPQDTELLDLTVDENARYVGHLLGRDLTVADFNADRKYVLTQQVSRLGYLDERGIAGIYSASKIDPVETQNVTLYEGVGGRVRVPIRAEYVESLSADSGALVEACSTLGVRIETADEYHARWMRETGF